MTLIYIYIYIYISRKNIKLRNKFTNIVTRSQDIFDSVCSDSVYVILIVFTLFLSLIFYNRIHSQMFITHTNILVLNLHELIKM